MSKALPDPELHNPLAIVVIGMAGTGKTSFVSSLLNFLLNKGKRVYTINLDPAVSNVPYKINIDIRDTVNYKEVMKQYKLGPNGAIMTSLNLFSTRFDKVLEILDKRAAKLDYILVDTPGQIEIFNWSASGTIILDSLAISYPSTVAYVMDTPRCQKPVTFMSNMLYACSVLYKSKLPFFLCFNKIDVNDHKLCLDWMRDYESYQEHVQKVDTYIGSLSRSFALVLNEFYYSIKTVGVSSATLEGMENVLITLEGKKEDYFKNYLPWIHKQKEKLEERRTQKNAEDFNKFEQDFKNSLNISSDKD